MSVKIASTSLDINGKSSGGIIENKCVIRSWYNRQWIKVLRPNNEITAKNLSESIKQICKNNIKCTYNKITNLYTLASQNNWNLSIIPTEECYTKNEELIAVCAQASGLFIPPNSSLKTISNFLLRSGKFNLLEDSKYLTTSEYLKNGDILISNDYACIVLKDKKQSYNSNIIATAYSLDPVRVRSGPGPQYKTIGVVNQKTNIQIISLLDNNWYKILWNNNYAYVNSIYFKCDIQLNKQSIIVNQNRKIIKNTNIKSGPGNNYSTIGVANEKTIYTIIKINNNWGCIKSSNSWVLLDDTEKI